MFRHITLPLILPAVLVAVTFRTIDALRLFDLVYVLAGNGPGTATMSIFARQQMVEFHHLGAGSAAALLLARRDRERFTIREQRKTSLLALVCFFFLVWTTWGVGAQVVFWGFLVLLLGTPLYIWFKTRVPAAA
jgi:fatty acid desaturase